MVVWLNLIVTKLMPSISFCKCFYCSSLPEFSINIDARVLDDVPILSEDMYAKLNELNPNKAAGTDNWPPKVLKEMADQLCIPLSTLFSKCLNSSTLPTS